MYNRYIPAEDGTYRRHIVEERQSVPPTPSPQQPQALPQKLPLEKAKQEPANKLPKIPVLKGMDTADLLILLILLLVMSDKGEDNTSLLLTAALYFLLQ